jgi:cytochrome c553
MSKKQPATWLTIASFGAIVMMATMVRSPGVRAEDNQNDHESRIRRGLEITPVPLKLEGKNRALVGLGSYLVNAVASCNDCHSAGPQTQFVSGNNPYFGQPAKENPATYLGGGRNFGPLVPGSPDIVSRNLTPDNTGLPAGGRSFSEFRQILKTGADLDHLHPTCASGQTTDCLPPPFDGNRLQIMPWPSYQNLDERDIRAIYEYLSAIPCIEGPPAPSVLHNDCQ